MRHAGHAQFTDHRWLAIIGATFILSGCFGDDTPTYHLSGTVAGLASDGLTLTVDGSTAVAVSNGTSSIRLASGLRSGTPYTVTVATQPNGQTCSVAGGNGVVASANVSNIVVTCSAQAFALGGTISGLNVSGLQLANGTDTLAVPTGATTFTMPANVAASSSYQVTVSAQPSGAACAVTNGSGTMPSHALSDIAVTCSDGPFTVGGSITGLGAHGGLVLANGSDTLHVDPSATRFTMPASVYSGSQYSVQVLSNPAGLTCSTNNGAGSVAATSVTDISVTCAPVAYSVGGTISNLTAPGLKLANSSDTLSVNAGANNFTMSDLVAYTDSYNITVVQNPTGETCTVAHGSAIMGTGNVTDVAITCSTSTVTIQGTINGLGPSSGLVLLDNNGDATSINANANSFSMNTGVAYGSSYDITVGVQPYGINLACTVSGGSGTANGSMNPLTVNCAAVSSVTQNEILGYFNYPVAVALDASKNLFVADAAANEVREFPFNNGSYGVRPIIVKSGLNSPDGVVLDPNRNVFIADFQSGTVFRVDYANGGYDASATTVVSGLQSASGVALDPNGNVFVSDMNAGTIIKVPYANGSYSPTPTTIGSGFNFPTGLALDGAGNIFVTTVFDSTLLEIVNNSGTYASGTTPVGSGLNSPSQVTLDASGNLLVADTSNNAIEEFQFSNGTYGATPTPLGSTWNNPQGLALDGDGNLFVADSVSHTVKELALSNGSYATTPVIVGPGITDAVSAAVDANGNVLIADSGNANVSEISFNGGNYGTPAAVTTIPIQPTNVALDPSGNIFVADGNHNSVLEIGYSNGAYSTTPVTLGPGLGAISGLAVDSSHNVFAADANSQAVVEYVYSNNSYSPTPTQVASVTNTLGTIAVDSSGDLFVFEQDNGGMQPVGKLEEFVYSNGHYSNTPIVLSSAFSQISAVVVDKNGNVFFGEQTGNTIQELVSTNGSYSSSPVTVSSGYANIQYLALDSQGRVYAGDSADLKILTP